MLPWKLQNLSSVYFSLAKFQLVSCNLSLAMIWQMTYTHKLPTLCSATLTLCELDYVTADLYHAKWPNKPRIVWHYKIKMLLFLFLLVHKYTLLFAFGASIIWSCTWQNEAWYRYPWRNIRFINWIGFVSSIQSLVRINYTVLCYSCMSM